MKKTKTLFVIGLMIVGFGNLYAQGGDTLQTKSYEVKAEAVTSRLERELSLTENQTRQVHKLMEERFSGLQKIATTDATRWESVNGPARQKLASILTREQYDRYLQLRQETRKQKDEFLKKNPGYTFSDEDRELDF